MKFEHRFVASLLSAFCPLQLLKNAFFFQYSGYDLAQLSTIEVGHSSSINNSAHNVFTTAKFQFHSENFPTRRSGVRDVKN